MAIFSILLCPSHSLSASERSYVVLRKNPLQQVWGERVREDFGLSIAAFTLSGPFNDSQSHNYLVKIPKCPFQKMKLLITPFSHINCSSPLLWCLPFPSSRKPSYHIFELFCTFLDIIFHTLLSKLFLTLISFVEHCQ